MGNIRNIRLICQYDGTDLAGFQKQSNARTVQGDLEAALTPILGHAPRLFGAGRTDAGVHALQQVVNFHTDKDKIPPVTLQKALNSILKSDIRVIGCGDVPLEFHSRKSALSKKYYYRICNASTLNVFNRRYSWWVPQKLNVAVMEEAARYFIGRRDFASFQGAGSPRVDSVRCVMSLSCTLDGDEIRVGIEANGFLYKMVRNIVGCLVEVGRGKLDPERIPGIITLQDRRMAPATAPPEGLYLEEVIYRQEY